ncbi:MAG TPA: hypothetical protein VGD17_20435 [Chitinophagaceae bacterium]
MKKFNNSAWRCNRQSFALHQPSNGITRFISKLFTALFLLSFIMTGCKKETASVNIPEIQAGNAQNDEATVLGQYTGISAITMWELQQARASSARYRKFENALKDGYINIDVVSQNMGHHFLNPANLDAIFDYKKPEILVYNPDDNGVMQLVAVEYAVPIELTPVVAPSGFTGNHDVWDRNTFFGLWLLHSWVWAYNPAGVFNPTNPAVHVHL